MANAKLAYYKNRVKYLSACIKDKGRKGKKKELKEVQRQTKSKGIEHGATLSLTDLSPFDLHEENVTFMEVQENKKEKEDEKKKERKKENKNENKNKNESGEKKEDEWQWPVISHSDAQDAVQTFLEVSIVPDVVELPSKVIPSNELFPSFMTFYNSWYALEHKLPLNGICPKTFNSVMSRLVDQ